MNKNIVNSLHISHNKMPTGSLIIGHLSKSLFLSLDLDTLISELISNNKLKLKEQPRVDLVISKPTTT